MGDDITLPPETIDQIIDALALEDGHYLPSIKSFSLVCRAALPRCRKHIFGSISLYQSRNCRAYTGESLSALLTATPELAPYIHKVIYEFQDPDESRGLSILPSLFARLTQVQSLTLISFDKYLPWNVPCHRPVLLPLLYSSALTQLELNGIRGFILCDLTPCVNLRGLEITSFLGRFGPSPIKLPSMLTTPPITLDRFSFTAKNTVPLREIWTARRPDGKGILDLSNLKKLSLRFRTANDLRLPSIIEFFGSQQCLMEVELKIQGCPSALGGLFDILSNSLGTLKRLSLALYLQYDLKDEITDPIPVLCHELDQMNGRNVIESLEIKVFAHTGVASLATQANSLGTLDGALTHGGWPVLSFVSFLAGCAKPKSSVDEQLAKAKDLVATHFTRLMSSPTIRFDYHVVFGTPKARRR